MTAAATATLCVTRSLLGRRLPIFSIKRKTLHSNPLRPPPPLPTTLNRTMASSLSSSSASSAIGKSESEEMEKITAPYGSWKSPITAEVVSGAEKRLGGFAVAGDGRLLWIETRPQEKGRTVLVKEPEKPGDKPLDVIPAEFAARTLAQEYGGGAFAVLEDMVVFSNYKDQRLYKQFIGESIEIAVEFEGVPPICNKCSCFGHVDALCPTKQVWQPKEEVDVPKEEVMEILHETTQASSQLGLECIGKICIEPCTAGEKAQYPDKYPFVSEGSIPVDSEIKEEIEVETAAT